MVRKTAGNQPNPRELCSSLCSCEHRLILFSFSTLQCSLAILSSLDAAANDFFNLFPVEVLGALGAGY